jgi:hypothetical protein
LLTKSRDLAVRPIEYADASDPVSAARARGVEHIVTGRYYLEQDQRLSLAIEAQHVSQGSGHTVVCFSTRFLSSTHACE